MAIGNHLLDASAKTDGASTNNSRFVRTAGRKHCGELVPEGVGQISMANNERLNAIYCLRMVGNSEF